MAASVPAAREDAAYPGQAPGKCTSRARIADVAWLMLERVLSAARSSGCHKVQLLSHKRHATDGAHELYLSVGFEPEAEGFRLYLNP